LLHVLGVDDLCPPPAFKLVEGKSEELRPWLVEIIHVPVGVGGEDFLRYGLDQEAVALLAGAQRLLQPLALRDIMDTPDVRSGGARRVPLKRNEPLRPDERAVLADEALLQSEVRGFAPKQRRVRIDAGCQIVGMRDVLIRPLEQFLAGVADDRATL